MVVVMAMGGQIGRECGKAALTPSKPSLKDIEAKLIEGFSTAAKEINQKCPMMLDDETRIDKVTVGPGTRIVYHHTFPNYNSDEIDGNLIRTDLRDQVIRKVCSNEKMEKSIRYGGIYVYSYCAKDNVEIARFEIDRNDCGYASTTP
jgi:hypothetical protein